MKNKVDELVLGNLLAEKLNYSFENHNLLKTALLHRSYNNQKPKNSELADNQRLEFLGDTVLGLAMSTILYHKFPDIKEGLLSRIRAGLVCETTLSEVALTLGLGELLFLGPGEESGGGRLKPSLLADALEAILGAVFLDKNFEAAQLMVRKLWAPYLDNPELKDSWTDYKTKLQEKTQEERGLAPNYKLVSAEGPDHAKTFTVSAVLGTEELGRASGRSKKEAEQKAAQLSLKQFETLKLTEPLKMAEIKND